MAVNPSKVIETVLLIHMLRARPDESGSRLPVTEKIVPIESGSGGPYNNSMYYTYVLWSAKDQRLYIGSTQDLGARLARHQRGFVPATRNRLPLTLIGFEQFSTRPEAIQRERQLKSWKNPHAVRQLFLGP